MIILLGESEPSYVFDTIISRDKGIGFRGGLLKATGLTSAGLRQLRQGMLKLRENLSDAARAKQ